MLPVIAFVLLHLFISVVLLAEIKQKYNNYMIVVIFLLFSLISLSGTRLMVRGHNGVRFIVKERIMEMRNE